MKIGNPLRRFRLIPAVMVLSAALLAVKGAGLALDARAQEQQGAPAPAAPATDQAAQSPDPAADDDAATSSAQVDVLTSLAKRRIELDARERDLEMRGNLIAAAEKRVDGKIDNLKQLQTQIQTLLGQRDAADQKQLAALVKTYSAMGKKAAHIFDNLNEDVLLTIAAQMKPDDLSPILEAMQPAAAQRLTVRLANHLKLPDPAPATPQQLAAAAPAAGPGATAPPPAQASATPPPGATPATTPPAAAPATGKIAAGATAPPAQAPVK